MNKNLPSKRPKKRLIGETPDITRFINQLNEEGVELVVDIKRQKDNEVVFTLVCRNSLKDKGALTRALFHFFSK